MTSQFPLARMKNYNYFDLSRFAAENAGYLTRDNTLFLSAHCNLTYSCE